MAWIVQYHRLPCIHLGLISWPVFSCVTGGRLYSLPSTTLQGCQGWLFCHNEKVFMPANYFWKRKLFRRSGFNGGKTVVPCKKNSPTLVKLQVKLTVRYAKVFSIWEHSPEHSISGCALDPAGGSGLIWKASTYAASFWFWIRLWSREINRI